VPNASDLVAVVPELILTVAAGLLLLGGAFVPRMRRALPWLGLLATVAAGGARLALPLPGDVWGGMLRVDRVAAFVDLYILAALALSLWIAAPFLARMERDRGEFHALLMLAAVGAMVMAASVNLLPLFLGLELLSIPLYVLNAYLTRVEISVEAGLKYFIVGAFAAAIVAYGMALLYGAAGTANLAELARAAAAPGTPRPLLLLGFAMVLGGFAFKLALFPFHGWAPDVYQGGPTPVTAFLSVVPKGAALVVVLRLVEAVAPGRLSGRWLLAGAILAVASQTLGNVVALVQRDVKRMLAYSGIAHMGYAMVGVVAFGRDGAAAVLVYLAAYTFMNLGAFAAVALLSEREDEPHLISDLAGQGWRRPVVALALTVCMFSLAGVPPFVGFVGKFLLFRSAVNAGLVWLAVLGVLNSLLSAYYYLRVVYVLYMRPLPRRAPAFPVSPTLTAAAAVAAAAVLAVGLYPVPVLEAARAAARLLVG